MPMLPKQPAPFLSKTWGLLDDPNNAHLITWSPSGESFIVVQPDAFARELLPTVFKHNNYTSFVRQLNIYGFRKLPASHQEFSHTCFKKGQAHLLTQISRGGLPSNSSSEGPAAEVADLKSQVDRLSKALIRAIAELQKLGFDALTFDWNKLVFMEPDSGTGHLVPAEPQPSGSRKRAAASGSLMYLQATVDECRAERQASATDQPHDGQYPNKQMKYDPSGPSHSHGGIPAPPGSAMPLMAPHSIPGVPPPHLHIAGLPALPLSLAGGVPHTGASQALVTLADVASLVDTSKGPASAAAVPMLPGVPMPAKYAPVGAATPPPPSAGESSADQGQQGEGQMQDTAAADGTGGVPAPSTDFQLQPQMLAQLVAQHQPGLTPEQAQEQVSRWFSGDPSALAAILPGGVPAFTLMGPTLGGLSVTYQADTGAVVPQPSAVPAAPAEAAAPVEEGGGPAVAVPQAESDLDGGVEEPGKSQ